MNYVMDVLRKGELWMSDHLGCSQEEGQEVVVIDAPHPVTARRLQVVLQLHLAYQPHVAVEKQPYQLLQFVLPTEAKSEQRPAEVHEGHLVA